MSGRASKVKGSAGEREVVEILTAAGYHVHRTPHSGALEWLKGDITGLPDVHIEVKRCESLRIPDWCRKAEADADGKTALVIFRRSREPWRVCLKLDDFLRMVES